MKILNQAMAQAVYDAMCALNNVGGSLNAVIDKRVRVEETHSGSIQVWTIDNIDNPEHYKTQADFARAYNLQ